MVRAILWNPIVEKEIRSRMRTWRSSFTITVCVALLGGLGWLIYSLVSAFTKNYGGAGAPVNYGLILFFVLMVFQTVLLTFVTPALAAGAITGERERQTLDVLLCTPLSALAIIWGKIAASMVYVLLLLVMLAPVFSLTFLFGGVELHQLVIAVILTMSSALTLATIGLLWSTVFRRTVPSMVVAYVTTFLLFVGAPAAGWIWQISHLSAMYQSAPAATRVASEAAVISSLSPLVAFITLAVDAPTAPSNPGQPASSFSAVPAGPLQGWAYWQVTLLLQGLCCLVALAISTYLLAPARGAPWRG